MKSNVLVAALLLAMVGCSQPEPPAPAADAPATTAPAGPEDAPADAEAALLPAGITLDLPRELRADRTYTNENGVERRRVTFEFLEGDIASALASVDASMATAGFAAQPRQEQRNGNVLVPYVKGGYGDLLVYAGPVTAPRHPDAKGLLIYDFRTAP